MLFHTRQQLELALEGRALISLHCAMQMDQLLEFSSSTATEWTLF